MSSEEILVTFILGAIFLSFIVLSIILLQGKGAWLIGGYNTMPKEKKVQYDERKLTKFVGKYLLFNAFGLVTIWLGIYLGKQIFIIITVAVLLLSTIYVIIVANGPRFKK